MFNLSTKVATLEGDGRAVNALAVLDAGSLPSGSDGKTIKVWDVAAALREDERPVRALAVHDEGHLTSGLDTPFRKIAAFDESMKVWSAYGKDRRKGKGWGKGNA